MNFYHFLSLVDTQARLSLKAEASRLYLSYFWWILEPMLFVMVFYFVFEILLNFGREDFLLFLICGKIPFLWFSKSVTMASISIVHNKGLISQVHMPKSLFPYIAVQEALYKQWAVFLVLFVFVMGYGYTPETNWLWLVPLMVVQYLLIVVCALIGALLVSFMLDMYMLITMGMVLLMFSSGIFWDIGALPDPELRQLLLVVNPLAFLIDGYRVVLMKQSVYNLSHLMWLGFSLSVFIALVHWLFWRSSQIIAARVLNA